MTHAPYSLIGDLVIVYGKTTKTACGKRVATDKLVSRAVADCPACREQIAADRAEADRFARLAYELSLEGE